MECNQLQKDEKIRRILQCAERMHTAAQQVLAVSVKMFDAFPYAEKDGDDEKTFELRQALLEYEQVQRGNLSFGVSSRESKTTRIFDST